MSLYIAAQLPPKIFPAIRQWLFTILCKVLAVKKGDVLAVFYGNDPKKLENGMNEAAKAFRITDEPADRPVLIKKIIGLSQE